MFEDVKNCNGDVPIINVDDIHCETIKNVNKEHIGAFYKTANGKFVIVLKEVGLKDLYSYEINFKGKVGYTEHIYRILPLPPPRGNGRGRTNFSNAVFVTMFLLTTVSDTAVKKANLEFGEVHVFSGKFKKPCNGISNGKRHIRITSSKTKDDLPIKYSLMILGFFKSCGLRRKYHATSVYICCGILATQLQITSQMRAVP